MKTLQLIRKFRDEKVLSGAQADALGEIYGNRRFSLHGELRALLYVGVLCLAGGIGLVVKEYFNQLGAIAIIGSLSFLCLGAFVYCWKEGGEFSTGEVKAPGLAFDYVLLLGCLVYSLDVAYAETHFRLLHRFWKNYLLFSSVLFGYLSYRFDNRLVLSLALSTLAAWFGFKLSDLHFSSVETYRLSAVGYGLLVALAGGLLHRAAIKKHFTGLYFNFAANFLFAAAVSGVVQYELFSPYTPGLALLCGISAVYGVRSRKFLYLLYAVMYGFVGLSAIILKNVHVPGFAFLYFIGSSLAVVGLLVFLSHKFRAEA